MPSDLPCQLTSSWDFGDYFNDVLNNPSPALSWNDTRQHLAFLFPRLERDYLQQLAKITKTPLPSRVPLPPRDRSQSYDTHERATRLVAVNYLISVCDAVEKNMPAYWRNLEVLNMVNHEMPRLRKLLLQIREVAIKFCLPGENNDDLVTCCSPVQPETLNYEEEDSREEASLNCTTPTQDQIMNEDYRSPLSQSPASSHHLTYSSTENLSLITHSICPISASLVSPMCSDCTFPISNWQLDISWKPFGVAPLMKNERAERSTSRSAAEYDQRSLDSSSVSSQISSENEDPTDTSSFKDLDEMESIFEKAACSQCIPNPRPPTHFFVEAVDDQKNTEESMAKIIESMNRNIELETMNVCQELEL